MSTSSGQDTHLPPLWWVPALAPDERTPDGPPAEVPSWATWIEDVLDVLATLAARGHQRATESLPVCTAFLQAILARDGPRCGTPNGVASPGLLTGLAGIG